MHESGISGSSRDKQLSLRLEPPRHSFGLSAGESERSPSPQTRDEVGPVYVACHRSLLFLSTEHPHLQRRWLATTVIVCSCRLTDWVHPRTKFVAPARLTSRMESSTIISIIAAFVTIAVVGAWVGGYLDRYQKIAQDHALDAMGENRASYGLKSTTYKEVRLATMLIVLQVH